MLELLSLLALPIGAPIRVDDEVDEFIATDLLEIFGSPMC